MWKIQTRSIPRQGGLNPLFILLVLGLSLSATPPTLSFGQSLDEGLLPGLVVHYSMPDGRVISDIAESPRFDFRNGFPNTDLRAIPQQITYQGLWLPDGKGTYQWTLSGQGEFQVRVNGKEVGSGSVTANQSFQTRVFETDADWQTLEVRVKPDGNQSFLRISTSNPKFLPEPLPPLRLAHEDLESSSDSIANGRLHFDTYRCQACHTISRGWDLESSPSLFGKRPLPTTQWLRNWLEKTNFS